MQINKDYANFNLLMVVTIQVVKNKNESPSSLIRRFTKRVQESGVVKTAKGRRYKTRNISEYKKKKNTLRRITKRATVERLKRLGKSLNVLRKR